VVKFWARQSWPICYYIAFLPPGGFLLLKQLIHSNTSQFWRRKTGYPSSLLPPGDRADKSPLEDGIGNEVEIAIVFGTVIHEHIHCIIRSQ
jgi:hypothetical protein